MAELFKRKWLSCAEQEGVLRFPMEHVPFKTIPGSINFKVYFNAERMRSKRKPDTFGKPAGPSTTSNTKFNFTKISSKEIISSDENDIIIINTAPATRYHFLFVPDVHQILPQKMTESAMKKTLLLMKSLGHDCCMFGFNSPSACASVDHLHMHGLVWEHGILPVQCIDFKPLKDTCINYSDAIYRRQYKLTVDVNDDHSITSVSQKIQNWANFIEEMSIAYNILILPSLPKCESASDDSMAALVDVIFCPRNPVVDDLGWMSSGCLELGGCILISTEERFGTVSEPDITDFIRTTVQLSHETISQLEQMMIQHELENGC